jgi:tetratricopeptide (TPR) repeat protein
MAFWTLGRLDEAIEQLRLSRAAAERFGNLGVLRWLDAFDVMYLEVRGDWNEALRLADAWLAAGKSPDYQESGVRSVRVSIHLSRGNMPMALADSKLALDQARAASDPQVLDPTLLIRAKVLLATGQMLEAAALLDELAEAAPDLSSSAMKGLATAMLQVGREQEFLRMTEASRDSPWLEAEIATAQHRFEDAARIYEAIGARPGVAASRMAAAEAAAAEGRRAEAEEQLSHALEYYKGVGAIEYVRRGEELLATPA